MRDKTDTTSEQNDNSPCAGACPNTPVEALVELGQKNHYGAIPTVRLFLAKYHTYPNTLECTNNDEDILYHVTTVLDYIRDELKHDINQDCVLRRRHQRTKQKYVYSRVTDLGNGIMIEFSDASLNCEVQNPNNLKVDHADNYFLTTEEIKIYYLPKHDVFVDDLSERFSQMTVFSSKSCTLEMVCKNDCGYYLRESKGIVLLHGIPGSGKTHYIRYLIQEVQDKTLIYIPPDMAKEIASPAFLPFLMEYQDAILIIEDAENIIKDRNESAAPSQAVANLLNLSDGLLGDAMHQQIIATFNCDLTTIDPALLRKGRLIANYEFNKLDLESSKILSDKLGFGRECVNEPMTLAEIYNQNGKNSQLDD
ncbi:unnamed protein product [Adineta steineri]|uniref:ATPase AAA-type core domain-containing protein n=1 Tax=Adineta steineri TaxID=433720 RepID=A0A814DDD0_9BILA|nr:unnamed protein product [Adineta steineri]CAF0960575.1 unnamed protein product [Adineta steineri]